MPSTNKGKEQFIKEYWDYQELKGIQREAKEEGKEETMREVIATMYSNSFTLDQIANALNLKIDYVEEVLNSK
ncbi:MAG: hypothetical protein IKM20_08180 [Erysipelotrichales bacterium]|nr:hypothetical protein [Erysipelotrichales bacterium]